MPEVTEANTLIGQRVQLVVGRILLLSYCLAKAAQGGTE